jgi:hypothetical protein
MILQPSQSWPSILTMALLLPLADHSWGAFEPHASNRLILMAQDLAYAPRAFAVMTKIASEAGIDTDISWELLGHVMPGLCDYSSIPGKLESISKPEWVQKLESPTLCPACAPTQPPHSHKPLLSHSASTDLQACRLHTQRL